MRSYKSFGDSRAKATPYATTCLLQARYLGLDESDGDIPFAIPCILGTLTDDP